LEAILRVRVSNGLDVDSYVGSFYKPPNSPTDLYLPAIDCDKALVARLVLTEKLPANSEVSTLAMPDLSWLSVVAVLLLASAGWCSLQQQPVAGEAGTSWCGVLCLMLSFAMQQLCMSKLS
jgi:hypothetical protein